MQLSGNKFRLIPETNSLEFVFDNLLIDVATGVAEIGFSGNGVSHRYLFANSFIYSPSGEKVGSYNTNEPFAISGTFGTTTFDYYINGDFIEMGMPKQNYRFQRFFVNTTGCNLNVDANFYCDQMETGVEVSGTFKALSGVSGRIINNSTNKIRVFDSSLFFYGSYDTLLTGRITGDVPTGGSLSFALADLDSGRFDSTLNFVMRLDTSIGVIQKRFTVNRVSGLSDVVRTLYSSTGDTTFDVEFFGSGLANRFIYVPPTDQSLYLSYTAFAETLSGVSQPKRLTLSVDAVSPLQSGSLRAEYVTGISMTNTGQYATCPEARFTGYYSVTGFEFVNTFLLSSGCTGNIPVTFTRNTSYGTGASGSMAVRRVRLSGIYGNTIQTFYAYNGITMLSGGTGYTVAPTASLNTGVYSNCFDVAQISGSSSIYTPFNPTVGLTPNAAYLTGLVLCGTGLVSGGAATGYTVTGIEITNVGSGYNTGYFVPRVSFFRGVGDTLTQNATGSFLMKTGYRYIFNEHWTIYTGVGGFPMVQLTGTGLPYTGSIYLEPEQSYVSVQIIHSGLDHTQSVALRVTLTNENGSGVSNLVSGRKTYDITTGHLKKKSLDSYIYYTPRSELSFLLTQDELDTIYDDPAFTSNDGLDVGDLDF